MRELKEAWISGVGHYTPERVLTNQELEGIVDTTDEWITTRTGIKERRIASDDQSTSDLAAKAGQAAIDMAGIKKEEIDLILVSTITPDMVFPATAALVQEKLGIPETGTVDMEAACTGFIYGVSTASQFVQTGKYRNILVVGCETMSRIVDWKDRNTCVLFGDGAGAVVVSQAPEGSNSRIIDFYLRGMGKYGNLLFMPSGGSASPATRETVEAGGHYLRMQGSETFKLAVNNMVDSINKVLGFAGMTAEDVDWLIPHQANLRIMKMVAKMAGIPVEKVVVNIEKYGNTSAATIPIALSEYVRDGRIKRGQKVVVVAFGGGMTWGSTLMEF